MGKASRRKKVVNPAVLVQYRTPIPLVARPFEGLPRKVEPAAMREIIPCVTLIARTNADHGFVDFDFVTAFPDGCGAMVRGDGRVLVALQTRPNSGDLSHDAGVALLNVISTKQNRDEGLVDFDMHDPSERLQDALDPDSFGEMVPEENFAFWLNPDEDWDEATCRALEENRNKIIPTVKVEDVEGMYWCEMNRNFVRYFSNVEESPLFDVLACVRAAGKANLGEGSRFAGAFRACGIAIPVFEPVEGVRAEDIVKEAGVLREVIAAALKVREPLAPEERRVRQSIVSRQVTIR